MQSIREFLTEYETLSIGKDLQGLSRMYADDFIVAGPKGAMAFKNDKKFKEWLKQLGQSNEDTGLKSMKIQNIIITPVGENYGSALATWGARFDKTGDKLIEFDITYILYLDEAGPKIVMYITHEDQETVMKKNGLL